MIDNTINDRLYAYIGGIIKELDGILIEINAMPEHIHFYAYMPKTISVSKFMEIVKANSSKWIHTTFPGKNDFGWQDGYGAFSVSKSSESAVLQYIQDQQKMTLFRPFGAKYFSIHCVQGALPPAIY